MAGIFTRNQMDKRAGKRVFRAVLAASVATIATGLFLPVARADLTWDPGNTPAAPTDGSGTWDFNTADWSNGSADVLWSDGSNADFGSDNGAAGTVTLAAPVTVGGLVFNPATTGNYTIATDPANDTITLNGPITVNAGVNPTISAPIAGGGGLTLTGAGTLTLAGANTYTGITTVTGGATLVVNPGSGLSVNTTSDGLVLGSSGIGAAGSTGTIGTTTGNLIDNANLTIGALTIQPNATANNQITISSGNTLTVAGTTTIGLRSYNGPPVFSPTTNVVISGDGTLALQGPMALGSSGDNGNTSVANVNFDMSNLTNFSMNTTGNLDVGTGQRIAATLSLANGNNTISVGTLNVSNGGSGSNNGNPCFLYLNGNTTIQATTIDVGYLKGIGTIAYAPSAAASASVTITGAGGAPNRVNAFNIAIATSATGPFTPSDVNLTGHDATVYADTLTVSELNNSTGGDLQGTFEFDTGLVDVNTLNIALNQKGTSANGTTGSFTLGTNANSTGVLNVNTAFNLLTKNSTSNTPSNGTFTIYGGTANINSNITAGGTNSTGARSSTLNLLGGTLNMMGYAIGSSAAPISTVTFPGAGQSATLANLSMGGINDAGLTMNQPGTLTLDGANTYTGPTAVTAGTLKIAATGSLAGTSAITVSSGAAFDVSALSGGLAVAVPLTINGSSTGAITVQNTIAGAGSAGDLTLAPGSLTMPGASPANGSIGTLTLSSLTGAGGNMLFDFGGNNADLINVTNAASFTGGSISLNIVGALTAGAHTILTAGSLTGAANLTLATTAIGRSTFSLTSTGGQLQIDVSGGSANLVWLGTGGVWDTTTAAWNNLTSGKNPDTYFDADNVTFDDTASTKTVTLNSTVIPGSVTVNTSGTYTIQGGGTIAGNSGLTKTGAGTLVLSTYNTYSGVTAIANGTLQVGSSGAIPATSAVVLGNGTASGALDLNGQSITISGLSTSGTGAANIIGNSNTNSPATLSFAGAAANTFAGAIQDTLNGGTQTVALTVNSGTLILTGANTYTGPTTINAGTLQIGAGTAAGSLSAATSITTNGTLAFNRPDAVTVPNAIAGSGTLEQDGAGTLILTGANSYNATNVNAGALQVGDGTANGSLGYGNVNLANTTLIFDHSDDFTINNIISGTGAIYQSGTGNLTLAGTVNYTAGLFVTSGTLLFANAAAIGPASIHVTTGGTLDTNGLNMGLQQHYASGIGVGGHGAIVNSGAATALFLNLNLTGDTTFGGTSEWDVHDSGATPGSLSTGGQPYNLIKTGANTVSFTGTTVDPALANIDIQQGTLELVDGADSTTTNGMGDPTKTVTVESGATLQFGTLAAAMNKVAVINGGSIYQSNGGTDTFAGPITLAGADNTFQVAGTLKVTGNVSAGPTNALDKTGAGTLALSGTNTIAGTVNILNGTIQAAGPAALAGANVVLGDPVNLTAGTLDLAGNNVSVSGLTSVASGTVVGSSSTTASSSLTFAGGATPSTFAGTIQDAINSGSQTTALVVTGGSLTLSSPNTYTGGTTINGGALAVGNTSGSALGTGNVTLNGGTLAGAGAIAGSILPGSGPHAIHPGPGGGVAGTLSVGGDLATNANTTLTFDLASPGGANDLLAVAGNLTLAGGTLAIASQATTGAASLGYYKVLSYAGALTGTTAGIVLPPVADNIAYTLDATQDAGFIDIHRGYIGDANDDGTVDLNDLNIVLNNLGAPNTSWTKGNFDGAATIDLNDLNDVLNHLGTSIASSAQQIVNTSPTATPEPATAGALLAFGALALIRRRRM